MFSRLCLHWSSSCLYGLKTTRLAYFFPLWRHEWFSIFQLSGLFICSWSVLSLFSHKNSKTNWWAFLMQSNFLFFCFCVFQLVFLQVVMKYLFDYFWKSTIPFSSPFSMIIVFGYSTPFTAQLCFNCYYWNRLLHLLVGGPAGAGNKFLACED